MTTSETALMLILVIEGYLLLGLAALHLEDRIAVPADEGPVNLDLEW